MQDQITPHGNVIVRKAAVGNRQKAATGAALHPFSEAG
jgi:hypothetical protein